MANSWTWRCAALLAITPLCVNAFAVDSDGDGVDDTVDNCSQAANADQRDSNNDGFGNACDADLNNDLIVNVVDLGLLRTVFFTADPDADANGDGTVNVVDLGAMRTQFFGPPGPGPTTPQGFGQRPVRIDADFDNNGVADATSMISYDDDGNVTRQLYTVTGDGTPDAFNFISEFGFDAIYTYENGLLVQVDQDNFTDGNDFRSVFTYDGNRRLMRTDETVFGPAGGVVSEIYIEYVYVNDLRVGENWRLTASNTLILVVTNVFGTDGQLETSTWANQFSPGGPIYDYDWNADGKIERRRLDVEGDGAFDETIDTLHVGGTVMSRTITGSLSYTPDFYRELPILGAGERIERIDYDANVDGTIDAVGTPVWEDGPCKVFFLPSLNPTKQTGADGTVGTAVGDVLFCGP